MPGEKITEATQTYLEKISSFNEYIENNEELDESYQIEVHGLPPKQKGRLLYDGIYVLEPAT